MPADIGINFRATAGYVADGADETYSLGEAYPTARGGAVFGWGADLTPSGLNLVRDRSTSVDRRLAGIVFANNAGPDPRTFRLDVPAAGDYDVRLAAGDAAAGQGPIVAVFDSDGTTPLFSFSPASGTAAGEFVDAMATAYAAAAWPGSNAARRVTLSGSSVFVRIGGTKATGTLSPLAHLRVTQVGGDVAAPTLSGWATNTSGTTITATLSEAVCTPASGTGGFTLGGTSATVASWAISGTTLTLTLLGTVLANDAPTVGYARSATTDDIRDPATNYLADFPPNPVANRSTVPALLVAPTLSAGTPGATSVTLSWAMAGGGTSSYSFQLQQAPDDSGSPGTWADVSGGTSSPRTVAGLTPGATYHFRVHVTGDGSEGDSNVEMVTMAAASGGDCGDATIENQIAILGELIAVRDEQSDQAATLVALGAAIADIQSRLPVALSGGRIKAAMYDDAGVEIPDIALRDIADSVAAVMATSPVGSVTDPVTVGTNDDKVGYALAASQSFDNSGQATPLPAELYYGGKAVAPRLNPA